MNSAENGISDRVKGHSMRWVYSAQKYGCSCGEQLYPGGEHKARYWHRAHKASVVRRTSSASEQEKA